MKKSVVGIVLALAVLVSACGREERSVFGAWHVPQLSRAGDGLTVSGVFLIEPNRMGMRNTCTGLGRTVVAEVFVRAEITETTMEALETKSAVETDGVVTRRVTLRPESKATYKLLSANQLRLSTSRTSTVLNRASR